MKYIIDLSKDMLEMLIDDNMSIFDAEKIINRVREGKPYAETYEHGLTDGYKMALQDLNIIGKEEK